MGTGLDELIQRRRPRRDTDRTRLGQAGRTHIPGVVTDIDARIMLLQHRCFLLGEGFAHDDVHAQPGDLEHVLRDRPVLGGDHDDARTRFTHRRQHIGRTGHRQTQRHTMLRVVLAIGRQQHVIRLIGQPPREDQVERQTDRRTDLVGIRIDTELRAHMLNRGDDPRGGIDQRHIQVETDRGAFAQDRCVLGG